MDKATLPSHHPHPRFTAKGTPYLTEPGFQFITRPETRIDVSLSPFLSGFDLGYEQYLDDPTTLEAGASVVKFAGQCCYASFGEKRSYNQEAQRYIDNILASGHGSVLEHANYGVLLYGISRSLTHELVRHRAGVAFSQLSQRYVSGRTLRFVERPEYQEDADLHQAFEDRIDAASVEYDRIAKHLQSAQGSEGILSAERKTDQRKKVNQTARSVLPNETETFLVVTANVRAWRHMIEMRASVHAETEIRRLFVGLCQGLQSLAPMLFADYEEVALSDGTVGIQSRLNYHKV